ncbi:MAG: hypothetical protein IKV36_02605 [Clostridia bacterium]|nr:hypothetical protein [Clostridia bacterium]
MSGSKYLSNLIHKLLHNNRFVAVFSIIIAVVMWLVISISENPQRTMNVNGVPVSINTQGTVVSTLGMEIVSDSYPKEVTVVVEGPSYIVGSLKNTDVLVSASLANVTEAGTFDLELTAQRNSSKTGYTIVSVNPQKITVSFDIVDEKEFGLELIAKGAEAENGLVIGELSVDNNLHNTITIKGPRTQMSKISTVAAVANVDKVVSKTDKYPASIVLYDDQGQELSSEFFEMSMESVDVIVPVLKEKNVDIKIDSASSSAINYIKYTLSQNKVLLRGEPSEIDKITTANITGIDFSKISAQNVNANGKFVLDATLDIPSTIEARDLEDLKIEFDLTNYVNKSFKAQNLETKDLAEGLSASFSSDFVEVTICGPANIINAVTADDLTVYANCAGKTAGVYGLNCTIVSEKYPAIWAVGTATASVTIK